MNLQCRFGWEMRGRTLESGRMMTTGTWICQCGRRGKTSVTDGNRYRVERTLLKLWTAHMRRRGGEERQ